jgi:hypothetical protein
MVAETTEAAADIQGTAISHNRSQGRGRRRRQSTWRLEKTGSREKAQGRRENPVWPIGTQARTGILVLLFGGGY